MRILLCAAAAAVLVAFGTANVHAAENVAVLVSGKDASYEETLKGFLGSLTRQSVDATYEVHKLGGNAAAAPRAITTVKKGGAKLVLTLGELATDAAVKEITDIPIVASMVVRTDTLKKASNVTGVGLEFPVEVQASWMQILLPKAKTIGVIFNPDENQKHVEAAKRILQNMGLKLVAQEVRSPQDVPRAVEGLIMQKVDAVWGMADSIAMNLKNAKTILPVLNRSNLPLIGPSPAWAKEGALYSLDWDYGDLGAQAGGMAVSILKGTPPSAVPAASARKVLYVLNLKTAQDLKIDFSEQIMRGARTTFTGAK